MEAKHNNHIIKKGYFIGFGPDPAISYVAAWDLEIMSLLTEFCVKQTVAKKGPFTWDEFYQAYFKWGYFKIKETYKLHGYGLRTFEQQEKYHKKLIQKLKLNHEYIHRRVILEKIRNESAKQGGK